MNDRTLILRWRSLLASLLLALLVTTTGCSSGKKDEATAEPGVPAAEGGEAAGQSEGGEEAAGPSDRVTLSEAAFATARIQVEPARAESGAEAGDGLEAPAQVELDPARVAMISPRTSGRIERLAAVVGDRVAAGQPVAYLTSPTFLTAQNDLILAARRAALLAGTADAEGARALVTAARRRLSLLGVSDAEIDRLASGGTPRPVLAVSAPFAGTIIDAPALAGTAVEAGTPIFKLADLSSVYVTADVPETALPSLRTGQTARVRLAAYPDYQASGRVERIADAVDPATRTVKAVVRVANSERRLRPGMFASVGLSVPAASGAATASVVTIPESAVITDGDDRYVFVQVGERAFLRRAVEVAPGASAGRVAIRSGVSAGERVVSNGAFTLKSELGKASLKDED
jgi:multidrug efflux pump subunit AcrA (membrane-fusion protein)